MHIHNKERLTYLQAIYMNSLNPVLKIQVKKPKLQWTENLTVYQP